MRLLLLLLEKVALDPLLLLPRSQLLVLVLVKVLESVLVLVLLLVLSLVLL